MSRRGMAVIPEEEALMAGAAGLVHDLRRLDGARTGIPI